MRKFLIRLGAVLGVLAAIATIIGTIYIIQGPPPPPPTPTPTLAPTSTLAPPTVTPFVVTAAKFVGQWDGVESSNGIHQAPTLIRLVISQQGDILTVRIFSQLGGVIPSQPQQSGTGSVSGGQVTLYTNGAPVDQWVLSLPDPATLHFTHHTHFPSGNPPDTDTSGDLHHA